MKFELELTLAQEINDAAETLTSSLQQEPENPLDVSNAFRPNHLQSIANLVEPEIPSGPLQVTIGVTGAEVARFFPHFNPPVGLFDQNHSDFITLCQRLQQTDAVQPYVSLTYVVEVLFEWMRLRRQGTAATSLSPYFASRCRKDIVSQEVWLPIVGVDIQQEIDFGRVVLKKPAQTTWQQWVAEWNVRKPAELSYIRQFFADMESEQVVVASQVVTGEPIRAVEIAQDWTQSALEILSYFAPSNFEPLMLIISAVSGNEIIERPRHMIVKDELLVSAGTTLVNLRSPHPWLIKSSFLKNMKEKGFDTLVRLMNQDDEKRSDFQNDILRAVAMFSRSALAQNLNDKLLYAVLALEFILLKNEGEPLQKYIGERMAYLIGPSWEARRSIIDDYKLAYALRSGAVHHGQIVTDDAVLKRFLPNAWHTLNRLISDADKFPTKQDMIDFIDDIKFS